jgi:hypothetical protein
METKVSIDAHVIRRYPDGEALAAVEDVMGAPERWAPSLIEHRLSSDFQADWKCEVGCWLLKARDLGFLDTLKSRLRRALGEAAQPEVTGPNESVLAGAFHHPEMQPRNQSRRVVCELRRPPGRPRLARQPDRGHAHGGSPGRPARCSGQSAPHRSRTSRPFDVPSAGKLG